MHFNFQWIIVLIISQLAHTKQPNIVFILADDLGYNDVGYHNPSVYTPNINQLSKEGLRLENYYVQPICTPTRSQLLTGRYQIHTGLQHGVLWPTQPHCLPINEVLLPQKLKEAGYSTHAVGKWHLGFCKEKCLPTRRGFDTFYGYLAGAEDYYSKKHAVKCDQNNKTYSGFDFRFNETVAEGVNSTYSSYQYRDQATKLIEHHDPKKRMFLYLAFQSVHAPMQVPKKYLKRYEHVKDFHRRYFLAMVTAMDDAIGGVVAALRKKKMLDETLIVFSTDNGGQTLYGGNNYPLRGRKASLWEGGVRGVGIVYGAAVAGMGRVSKELIHVSDWFPTLLHVAGVKTNGTKPLDGFNNWSHLSDPNAKSNRQELLHNIDPLFHRPYDPQPHLKPYPNRHGVNTTTGHSAIRVGRWKLFTGDPGFSGWVPEPHAEQLKSEQGEEARDEKEQESSVRLFDIEADPRERHDVARYFPKLVDSLLAKIAAYNRTAAPVAYPPCDPNSDPRLHGGVWTSWL